MASSSEVNAVDFNALVPNLSSEFKCKARVRYNMKEQDATAYVNGDKLKVVFDEPQKGHTTKGQAVVLYDDDIVIGGGTIV